MSEKRDLRRQNRVIAVNAVFAYFMREGTVELQECLDFSLEEAHELKDTDMAKNLVKIVEEEMGKLKVIVRVYAPEFTFEKIAPINRAILLVGLGELKFTDTPPIVVINEYIEIAKQYGEEKSASFVNGVLDSFRKNINKEREKEDGKQ